jgi:oxaloacetate decarboxylase (Na+ extruding) subunit alpha
MSTRLVDTTIRLLSQEPLADQVPTARLLELASVLDRAGFEFLEVTGGGCFDAAVRRGVESPWERIRAIRARCQTPLAMALRGRFLVGSRPVSRDLVRRFVAVAAESGIDVFRIHDPLNDVSNLTDAGEAVRAAGKELVVGLVHNPGAHDALEELVERARRLPDVGAARVVVNDPAGSLGAAHAREIVERVREACELPVGLYCQGAAGRALAAAIEAARGGATPIASTIYPVALTLYRPSAEALSQSLEGIGLETGMSLPTLWEACELVDEALGDEPVPPLTPRVAVRAAERDLPAGLVAGLDANLRAQGFGDRLDEVLAELAVIRDECGHPPLVSPIGHILASQALLHVLSAQRWGVVVDELYDLLEGRYGSPPRPIDPTVTRAVGLLDVGLRAEEPALEEIRDSAEGLAASEEELLLLALFGSEAEPLLQAIRGRARREETLATSGVDRQRAERIRELIAMVQESNIAEVTIEEGETRVTVRRSEERPEEVATVLPVASDEELAPVEPPSDLIRIESPMVGTFYRAPAPDDEPFVDVGDPVAPGQTLCILEAMKLMNEVKADAEAIVRRICVENAESVEYGQLLFELEPVNGRPLDAL